MPRIAAAITAAVLVVVGSYAATVTNDNRLINDNKVDSTSRLTTPIAGPQLPELDRLIVVFEQRIAENTDSLDYRTLGRFYFDRAWLTGNLNDYRSANTALSRALELSPGQPDATRLLGRGSLAVHQFGLALALTDSLLRADPLDADSLLIATDANIEMGRIDAAGTALDTLTLLAPGNPALLVRRAELSHLRGDQQGAIDLAALAHQNAADLGLEGRKLAFYALSHSDLVLDVGRYEEAATLVDKALAIAPEWSQSHASNARVLSAQGRYPEAITAYTAALERQADDPAWLASRADLLTAIGDDGEAAENLQRSIEILASDDPVIYGRSLSRLYSDHNIEPEEALRLAEADLKRRQDILGYDTYAWALYRNGRYAEAAEAIRPVMAAGLRDAGTRLHGGLILTAVGDTAAATAHLEWLLRTNPGFDPLLAQEARDALVVSGP